MRRWFAILVLVLLPLHFSWAAVAAYCGHEGGHERGSETAAQAQHLGHHEHQHADPAGGDKGGDPAGQNASVVNDLDCGHCHNNCCSLPTLRATSALSAKALRPASAAAGTLRTRPQSPPERPQWARLA